MAQDFGHVSGLTVGEVINVKDDPTQSGRVKVRWHLGSVSQNQLEEKDLPWTQCLFPSSNPCTRNTGGPVTGLQVGSKVYGQPLGGDGQDFLIIGAVPKAGSGAPDSEAKYDADVPHPGKVEKNNDKTQPTYGDKNSVVSNNSITTFGKQQGGKGNCATFYDTIKDSIGMISSITEQPLGQGGSGGIDALLHKLAGGGNQSGSSIPSPNLLLQLQQKIESVPFELLKPGMSGLISSGNMMSGLMALTNSLGNLDGFGNISQTISGITNSVGGGQSLSPSQIAQAAASTVSTSDLSAQLGPLNSLTTSLYGIG